MQEALAATAYQVALGGISHKYFPALELVEHARRLGIDPRCGCASEHSVVSVRYVSRVAGSR